MYSKISIDVDDQGLSTITISLPEAYERISDVRDKLVKRFLESGMFCLITRTGDNNEAQIHSMNVLDILANMGDIYGPLCKDSNKAFEFKEAIERLASLLGDITGERKSCFGSRVEVEAREGVDYELMPKK